MANGKLSHDLELKNTKRSAQSKSMHKPNQSLKAGKDHAGVYGMPTGKGMPSGRSSHPGDNDIKSEDGLAYMDQDRLRLIYKRMHTMSVKTVGDKISREDFIDRIFLEEELKDF
mmetsp:Transcript_58838/g.49778  ORF Transcript_58838/g.49778 Transcript_58838/m.49778 type:complete len:114 (+) Transcript_58838:216-557(+)